MHGRHKRGGPDAAQNGRCGEGKGQAAHGEAGRTRQTQHQENAGGADKGHGGNADGHDAVKLLNDGVQLAGQRNGNIVGIVKAAGIGNDRNGRLHIGSDINAAGIQVGKQSVIGGGLDAVAAVKGCVAVIQPCDGAVHVGSDLVARDGRGHYIGRKAGGGTVADEVVIQVGVRSLAESTACDLLLHKSGAANGGQQHQKKSKQRQQKAGQPGHDQGPNGIALGMGACGDILMHIQHPLSCSCPARGRIHIWHRRNSGSG